MMLWRSSELMPLSNGSDISVSYMLSIAQNYMMVRKGIYGYIVLTLKWGFLFWKSCADDDKAARS